MNEVSLIDILEVELKPWIENFEQGIWEFYRRTHLASSTTPDYFVLSFDRFDITIDIKEGDVVIYGVSVPERSDGDEWYTEELEIPLADPNMIEKLKSAIIEVAQSLHDTVY